MPDRPEGEARTVAEQKPESLSQVDVGGKVNAIIEAAEAAAQEIGQDARREAREMLQQAEKQAAARIEELTRVASEARAEADQYARDIREAADSYGTQHRRSVEEEARQALTSAEKKARELLESAKTSAEQIERDVVHRHATLQREAKMLEERRQRVLERLRDLAAQLQDALVEPTEKAPQDDALLDALDVERSR
jgi:vacuolar-type H+-ATPase subunit H